MIDALHLTNGLEVAFIPAPGMQAMRCIRPPARWKGVSVSVTGTVFALNSAIRSQEKRVGLSLNQVTQG
jgi:hypothetical protein